MYIVNHVVALLITNAIQARFSVVSALTQVADVS